MSSGREVRIKTEEEIASIRRASEILSGALTMLREHVVPGVTTVELDRLAEEYIRDNGGEPAFKGYAPRFAPGGVEPYPWTLCTSRNEEVVHGLPNEVPLVEGDLISLDAGVRWNGWNSDSAVTYGVGAITPERAQLLQVTEEALALGVEQAVAGNRVFDIARAVQRHVQAAGFGVVRELTGHGIGQSIHEDPDIPNFVPSPFQRHQFRNALLVSGMTICIEPMVCAGNYRVETAEDGWTVRTADGSPAAHFEHTVVIREGAPEVLTRWPSSIPASAAR